MVYRAAYEWDLTKSAALRNGLGGDVHAALSVGFQGQVQSEEEGTVWVVTHAALSNLSE